ncbi:MAG: DUF4440 domain-containing protein [Betaproteobacteria bacterium]
MSETIVLLEELVRLELALQQQRSVDDALGAQHLLRDDFFEFGSSGGLIDKQMVIDYLSTEVVDMTSGDFRLDVLAEGVALLTYRSVKRFGSARPPMYSNRSSLWTRANGHWVMFFHQGTPTKPFEFSTPV